jgi:hypothetical protein
LFEGICLLAGSHCNTVEVLTAIQEITNIASFFLEPLKILDEVVNELSISARLNRRWMCKYF